MSQVTQDQWPGRNMRARVHFQWLLVTPRGPCFFRGPLGVRDGEVLSLLSMEPHKNPRIPDSFHVSFPPTPIYLRPPQVATPHTASELRNIDHSTATCFGQRSQSGQTSCGKITHSVITQRWPRRGLKTDSARASHRSRGLRMIWEHSKGNDGFFFFLDLSRLQNHLEPSVPQPPTDD
jgi:hypothetical protein